eukprot:TRINITY_DN17600_c0_g1_i1.p1 TRINITY_DN17600_c0_g1~~TRINITY_DN17600_c0_g1_i1.p1  ORF type:complete len:216 (-),score=23.26 TRINITY_DN17600_c0_g1_i1:167-814(-)
MDKTQVFVSVFCAYLFVSDLFNAFSTPANPKKPHLHLHEHVDPIPLVKEPIKYTEKPLEQVGVQVNDAVVHISFCTSCSYRGTAMTMKKMLESAFPGINVVLSNYPPPLPKRMLSKLVPVLQIGSIVLVTAGDHIFPRLGYATPPLWYYSLKQKKFAVIASTWLVGNALQSYLQSTGAFEVECNGELIFSKLHENRFPGEYELRELVSRSLGIEG